MLTITQHKHDLLIIGAGLAGLRVAIQLAKDFDVAVITKVHPLRSHSVAAQGGINASLGEGDSWESHAFDTVKGSDYLGDQDCIEYMCYEAPEAVYELERMGMPFSRDEAGRIYQEKFSDEDGLIPASFDVVYFIGWTAVNK